MRSFFLSGLQNWIRSEFLRKACTTAPLLAPDLLRPSDRTKVMRITRSVLSPAVSNNC